MNHESCQSCSLSKNLILFIFLFIGVKSGAQNQESFKISIKQIEYIDIFNYYNERKLKFHIEDLYHKDGSAAGTRDILYVPLDLKTRN
tara:strand:+ start:10 stop:273 length:264 start_codon:yes stop_codon:yes gene_type:complete